MPRTLPFIALIVVVFFSFSESAAAAFNRDLAWGMSGTDVSELQTLLKNEGLFTEAPTGGYYLLTQEAVRQFQIKHGITPAAGFFGPLTRAKANAVAAGSTVSTVAGVSTSSTAAKETLLASLKAKLAELLKARDSKTASNSSKTKSSKSTSSSSSSSGSSSSSSGSSSSSSSGSSSSTPKPATTGSIEWGSYAGDSIASFTAFENTVGKKANIQAIFWSFNHPFPTEFNNLDSGKALLIFWEPDFDYDVLNSGTKDAYLKTFARAAGEYAKKHRLIMVPFNEPNLGDEEEIWGDTGDNTPEEFVAGWRRIHDIFEAEGAGAVEFGLAYNNFSTGPNPDFDDYYPGDAYVDHVGIDGFNWSDPGKTPTQVFSSAVSKIKGYGKPIYIYSTATPAGSGKAAWITAFGEYVKTIPNFKGWVWFHIDKEENWLVNSDQASLVAFRNAVGL